jgi:hypothetical protein
MSLEADNQIRLLTGCVRYASRLTDRPVFLCPRVAIKGGEGLRHFLLSLSFSFITTTLALTPRALFFDRSRNEVS